MNGSAARLRSHAFEIWISTALLSVLLLVAGAHESRAAGVVGMGTVASCTEAELDSALAGGGLVTFSCGATPATITVTSTKLITADTTVDSGSQITISGGGAVGVFVVKTGTAFTVQNLTIANGNGHSNPDGSGGGIENNGTLTLIHSTLSNNSASSNGAGIENNGGTLTVTGCNFSGNSLPNPLDFTNPSSSSGGGIHNNGGRLTVANSTFSGNSAGFGSGIYNSHGATTLTGSVVSGNGAVGEGGGIVSDGTLTVDTSTISGNEVVSGIGGGIVNRGTLALANSAVAGNGAFYYGGGVINSGTLTVTNSTIASNGSNSVDFFGGGILNYGTLTVISSTVSRNSAPYGGGGIDNISGSATLSNTIVGNNTGADCAVGCTSAGGTFTCTSITDGGHNISTDDSCGFSGTSFSNTDPRLDPAGLANHGGPTTTIALCTGPGAPSVGCTGASPAINAGDEVVCSMAPVNNLDQRGYGRPGAGATTCSIGAFESNSAPSMVATPTPTLQMSGASATPTATAIGSLAATRTPTQLRSATPTPSITPTPVPACVVGTGAAAGCTEAALTDCLPGGGRFTGAVSFNCGSGPITIRVTGTKIIGADTTIDGSALTILSGGNTVGVFSVNAGVTFTIRNLTIANGAAIFAGGIMNNGTLNVIYSTLSGNSGGIFNYNGTVTIANSIFSGNASDGNGGLDNEGGTVTVTASVFSGNSAGGDRYVGGGINNYENSSLTVVNSIFTGNTAGVEGGAIENSGTLKVVNSTLSHNSTDGSGGGISINAGTATVTGCTFDNNTAGDGGGIANADVGTTLTVSNSTFVGNSAASTATPYGVLGGGGIINFAGATMRVINCTFAGNSANYGASSGGAIYNQNSGDAATVTNTILAASATGGNCALGDFGGHITDGGHNIDDDGSCGFSGPPPSRTNPLLDPVGLADHGGPTHTIALQMGSPAINAGDQSVCAATPVNNLDQRGYQRPGTGDTTCSIGAYEYHAPPPACTGDCDGSGDVTVNEIIVLVNIALGIADQSACPTGISGGADVDVAMIVQAVNAALNGCSS